MSDQPYVRITRRPSQGIGRPQTRLIKRVELVDGNRVMLLPVQDIVINEPIGGPRFVTFTTQFFAEVIEQDGTENV